MEVDIMKRKQRIIRKIVDCEGNTIMVFYKDGTVWMYGKTN